MLEYSGRSLMLKKAGEISCRPCIRKVERTLRYAEIMLDEPENAAEVVPGVVYVAERGIGRDDK